MKTKLSKMRYTMNMPVAVNPKTQEYIGRKLRAIREEKDMSQLDVSEKVGVDVSYYAAIERGEKNPTTSVLEKLCAVLKIKSSEILPF